MPRTGARDVLRINPTIQEPGVPTRGACEAAASLGISIDRLANDHPAAPIKLTLRPGAVTLILGASGCGKTTLLRDVTRTAREHAWTVVQPDTRRLRSERATVDLFRADVPGAMRALARAGLGEAGVFIRRARQLSRGQRARLEVALAMERAERHAAGGAPTLLAVDELGSGLDRVTAAALARLLGRFARDSAVRLVAATAREDLEAALAPDEVVHARAMHAPHIERVRDRLTCGPIGVRIIEGRIADYRALAPLHYRPGDPATIEFVLAARDAETHELAGVLTISRPTLNGAWRTVAWGNRFAGGDRRADAARLNRELRCISRVIVDPRYRSLGIARALVRAYLDNPLTPRTEAIAAMGAACPFFEAAGMRRIETEIPGRHRTLLETLQHAGLARWRLATPHAAWTRIQSGTSRDEVTRALRIWANASGATRRLLHAPIEELFTRACRDVTTHPIAYVAEH